METVSAITDLFANRDSLINVAVVVAVVYFGWPYVSGFIAKPVAAFLDEVAANRKS